MSLYDVLAVKPDASDAEIKAAHRRQVKKTHPDAGGNAEDFDAVTKAFQVLSDQQRRAAYDETGQEGDAPKPEEAAFALIRNLIEAFIAEQGDPVRTDFVAKMHHQIDHAIQEVRAQVAATSQKIARCEKMSGRFSVKSGDNLVRSIIEVRTKEMRRQIDGMTQHIEVLQKAREIAKGYSYRIDEMPPVVTANDIFRMQANAASNGFGSRGSGVFGAF